MPLHRRGRALRRGDRRAQLVDGLGEALIADGERLVALQDLVGQPAQPAGETARHLVEPGGAVGHVLGGAPSQAGELVVLGVDKRRHRLQVDDQRRLEPDRRFELRLDQVDGRVDGLRHRPLARDVAVDVVDDRRVEPLLRAERGLEHAPDEAGGAAAPSRQGRHDVEDLPRLVERRDLVLVGAGRRTRQVGHPLDGAVHRRQRGVVAGVGGLAVGLQLRQFLRRHRPRDVVVHQRPTMPSTGLLAVAYMLRGFGRPGRPAGRRSPRGASPRPSAPGRCAPAIAVFISTPSAPSSIAMRRIRRGADAGVDDHRHAGVLADDPQVVRRSGCRGPSRSARRAASPRRRPASSSLRQTIGSSLV